MESKSPLKSLTVNGSLIGIVIFGIRLFYHDYTDADELHGLIDVLKTAWIDIGGIAASGIALWRRVAATNFDKSVLKQSTTWAGIFKGLAVILVALGYDVDPDQVSATAQHGFSTVTSVIGAVSTGMIIFGRIRASQPIQIKKPDSVE